MNNSQAFNELRDWKVVEWRLSRELFGLQDGHFLALDAPKGYLQFAGHADRRLLGECISPRFKWDGGEAYSTDELDFLEALGWPPVSLTSGPNYQRWWGTKSSLSPERARLLNIEDAEAAAALAVATLIVALKARLPADLKITRHKFYEFP